MASVELEDRCEDAVFEVCDARERYPQRCANELAQCLHLTTQINAAPIKLSAREALQPVELTEEQRCLLRDIVPHDRKSQKAELDRMLGTVEELRTVVEQIKRAEDTTIDNILKKKCS